MEILLDMNMFNIKNKDLELHEHVQDREKEWHVVPRQNIADVAKQLLEQIPANRFKVLMSKIILGLLNKNRNERISALFVQNYLKVYRRGPIRLSLKQETESCPDSISLAASFNDRMEGVLGFAKYILSLHDENLLRISEYGFGCNETGEKGQLVIHISRPTVLNYACNDETCRSIKCFKFRILNLDQYLSKESLMKITLENSDGHHCSKALDYYAFGILMLKVLCRDFFVLCVKRQKSIDDLTINDFNVVNEDEIEIARGLIDVISALVKGKGDIQNVVDHLKVQEEDDEEDEDSEATHFSDETEDVQELDL